MEISKAPHDKKKYELIAFKHNIWKDDLKTAYDIVESYIKEKSRILFGGMAIDMALRLKGKKLYDDDALPDYDFLSPENAEDAYAIGYLLYKKGLKNVDVVNAFHIYTMKVRVGFSVVADIGYIPKHMFDRLPTLEYQGFRFIHPHYQYIDQHISLCNPYVRAPDETVFRRWEKDMIRHDVLFAEYPIFLTDDPVKREKKSGGSKSDFKINFASTSSNTFIYNSCVTGYAALLLLNHISIESHKSGKIGKPVLDLEYNFEENVLTYPAPACARPAYYTDRFPDVIRRSQETPDRFIYRNSLLERLPPMILDKQNRFEIYDNTGRKVSASLFIPEFELFVANPQDLMRYFLLYHIYYGMSDDKESKSASEFMRNCYVLTRKLTITMIDDPRFSPNITVYGSHIYSESYFDNREQMLISLGIRTKKIIQKPKSLNFNKIKPDETFKYPEFDYSQFKIGFEETTPDLDLYSILDPVTKTTE